MPRDTRAYSWIRALTLLVVLGASCSQAQDARVTAAPAPALEVFYHSYLTLINESKDPLKSDPNLMNRYVDKCLLIKIGKQTNPDEDYFTKSQDILDDWIDHVAVTNRKCSQVTCEMQIVLGLPKPSLYKIDVDVKNTDNGWKITRVTRPATGR